MCNIFSNNQAGEKKTPRWKAIEGPGEALGAKKLVGQRGDHYGFDGVHPVLSLVEYHAVGGFKNFVGDFHAAVQIELLRHLFTQRGLIVVKRRQAVQEFDLRIAG